MKVYAKTVKEFDEVLRYFSENGANIYIFGAGNFGRILGEYLCQIALEWKGYIDNNLLLCDVIVQGKRVFGLYDIADKDAVIIMSISKRKYVEEYSQIIRNILDRGFREENILQIDDNYELMDDIIFSVRKPYKYLDKVKKLDNKFYGERCFIIGNGPSLRLEDLEKTSGCITMGCNGIIDLFDKTDWRPSCFFIVDGSFVPNYIHKADDLKRIVANCKMVFSGINNEIYEQYPDFLDELYLLNIRRRKDADCFSDRIDEVVYDSGTTLFAMIQVAVYMGIKSIYLLGVDNSFRREIDENGTVIINEQIPDHMELIKELHKGIYYKELINQVFRRAKEYADGHGIKIYNATRGGKLEIFERVDFDSLFNGE